MVKLIYKGENLNKVKKDILKAFDFAYKFLPVKTPDIVVRVHDTRVEFNKQLKMETADWVVANASKEGEIDILSPAAMLNESNHDKSEFLQILKHEFTHILSDAMSNKAATPKWLEEGLAAYVAKQNQNDLNPIYFEENFCKTLGTSKGWDENVNYGAYTIAALFVKFLINKYSFSKIKKLLASLDKNYYYSSFNNKFSLIYGVDVDEAEASFMAEVNK